MGGAPELVQSDISYNQVLINVTEWVNRFSITAGSMFDPMANPPMGRGPSAAVSADGSVAPRRVGEGANGGPLVQPQ